MNIKANLGVWCSKDTMHRLFRVGQKEKFDYWNFIYLSSQYQNALTYTCSIDTKLHVHSVYWYR